MPDPVLGGAVLAGRRSLTALQGQVMPEIPPWYWRSLPLEGRSGSAVFETLFQHLPVATLLESPAPQPQSFDPTLKLVNPQARYSICAGPPRLMGGQPQIWTPGVGNILAFLRGLLTRRPSSQGPSAAPFTGGWLGWLGYDLAWEVEQLPDLRRDPLPFPVAYWYEPECFAVMDHVQQQLWLAASDQAQLDRLHQAWLLPTRERPNSPAPVTGLNQPRPIFYTSQADYKAAVWQAKQYIQAGDIFQANLSLRFAASTTADSWQLYRTLQQINPSPFASYWQTPWGAVVSCSPERLVRLQGRQAQTRPIAGTRSRGNTPESDQQHCQDLLNSAKEKAEHIMLVDLERNDLGRVSEWGSVKVDEFLSVEYYSHVMHLVSNVVGRLRPGCDAVDLIQALFPGGTITGCPKVRCMEIIEALEPVRRNLFYGSCGYLDQHGDLDLNILIRTLLVVPALQENVKESIVWGQVGAGIVADSDPEQEWCESLHKAQAQLTALQLVSVYNQC